MNEQKIVNSLLRGRWLRSFVVPNYQPRGWWECDVFEITKAGYFVEYEVKCTIADFKRDAEKSMFDRFVKREVFEREDGTKMLQPPLTISKHDLISKGDVRGPKRFYFVTPAGLLQLIDVPKWAGLIEISERGNRLIEQCKIIAPDLHRQKIADEIKRHAEKVFYYRFHKLRQKLV